MKLTLKQIKNLNEQQWDRLVEIAVLHTRLAKEHIGLHNRPGTEGRLIEIRNQIIALRAEKNKILATAS